MSIKSKRCGILLWRGLSVVPEGIFEARSPLVKKTEPRELLDGIEGSSVMISEAHHILEMP